MASHTQSVGTFTATPHTYLSNQKIHVAVHESVVLPSRNETVSRVPINVKWFKE
jgi:hypothetical protein